MELPLDRLSLERALLERFHSAEISEGYVRSEIRESWRRCLDCGLTPANRPGSAGLARGELNDLREQNATLLRFAKRELKKLQAQIPGRNYLISFANADAVLLDVISDTSQPAEPTSEVVPGVRWNETTYGTNAIGLAALEKRPTTVHAREHFFSCYSHLTCAAAPIMGPDGDVVGILDVSSDSESRRQHVLALVCMSALQIEAEFFREQCRGNTILQFHSRGEFVDTLQAGLLALGDSGEILHASSRARYFLQDLPSQPNHNFEEIFRQRFTEFMASRTDGDALTQLADLKGSCYSVVVHHPARKHRSRVFLHNPVHAERHVPAPGFVCQDPNVLAALSAVRRAVELGVPILIQGETGTGKELLAQYAHQQSGRVGKFIAVNCAAIPGDLVEAELFGYREGAFTGARTGGSAGLIVQAQHGTLFLDEIGDMHLRLQPALLRFLDNHAVRAIGSNFEQAVDVQVIAATNSDLETAVAERRFRADLRHRISSVEVFLPPLRDRVDFREIVDDVLAALEPNSLITDEAFEILKSHPWGGNIRELKNVLTRMVIASSGHVISGAIAGSVLKKISGTEPKQPTLGTTVQASLETLRSKAVLEAYQKFDGNISKTASYLSVSRNTVYRQLRNRPR